MGPNPGVLLLASVDVPSGPPAERLLKSNCNVFGVSQEAAYLLSITEILNRQLGYGLSLRRGVSVLGDGRPIPLISYGLTEYLLSLDLSRFDVLELGGGQSTLFWSSKARSVCTLEHDAQWISRDPVREAQQLPDRPGRARRLSREDSRICQTNMTLSPLIVRPIAMSARSPLAASFGRRGMIVLDSPEWFPNTAAYLRSLDLIQVDFPDFRPLHHYRCITSIFLHPAFRPAIANGAFPPPPIGGKDIAAVNSWDFRGPRPGAHRR